jgi:flagellar biosynthesis component FlhA
LAFVSTLLFQLLSPSIFFFSNRRKEEKNKEKKTVEKKRNAKKGRSFPSSLCFAFSFLALVSAFPLLSFCFKRFLLAFSYFQYKKIRKNKEKKTIVEKKMQRREKTFLQTPALPSHFWLPLLPSRFCPFVSNAFS